MRNRVGLGGLVAVLLVFGCDVDAPPDAPAAPPLVESTPELAVCVRPDVEPTRPSARVTPVVDVPLWDATGFAERLSVQLALPRLDVVLELRRNDALFGPDYREQVWRGGRLVDVDERAARSCHYQGRVRTADGDALPDSVVALSTCTGGLDGVLSVGGGFYALHAEDDVGGHRLIEIDDPALHLLPNLGVLPNGEPRWVELLVVNDALRFQAYGNDVVTETAAIANITDALYQGGAFARPIRVVLVGQVTFEDGDPFAAQRVGDEVVAEDLLNEFGTWRAAHAGDLPSHDDASLLTNDDMNGNTNGIGWVGSMCNPNFSTNAVQNSRTNAHTAAVQAHEMGHNFGSDHDGVGNACADSGFLMAASICINCAAPDAWSACSVESIDGFLDRTGGACLENMPDGVDSDRCGDGLVTGDEACDCGQADCAGLDPCCDGATCELAAGAACAGSEGCCDPDTCAPLGAGALCRGAVDECDVAEVCDGANPACPADDGLPDGTACQDGGEDGACFAFRCESYQGQCLAVSPDANAAPCAAEQANDPCGDLICQINGQCFIFGDGLGGTLSVADGTLCGPNRQCVDGACEDIPGGDACPGDPDKIAPGACGCGTPDTDGDGDGTPDCDDACPADPDKIAPGGCGCGVSDADGDRDGTPDCDDACPADPEKTTAGACGCGVSDRDGDGDGTPDCLDGCPDDPAKNKPGACGCGMADRDSDGDGTPDCVDGCPADPGKAAAGACGCGVADVDRDGDGALDCLDGCPADPDKIAPGECGCGVSDADLDGDGRADCGDGCPADPNKDAPGVCGCGVSDADGDRDGTADCLDECPADPDKTSPGACGCGESDADEDGDGAVDCVDACPADPDKVDSGVCGCGVVDVDGDGDGVADCVDGCPADPDKSATGVCGCGTPDVDADGDGAADCQDACPGDPAKIEPGECGCGAPETPDCQIACDGAVAHGDVLVGTVGWTRVDLPAGFVAPVVVTTPQYSRAIGAVAVRMRGVGADGFELRLDVLQAVSGDFDLALTVHWVAIEAGVYTRAEHGVDLEARRVRIDTVDFRGTFWLDTAQAYLNAYRWPVVVGQVMTANDPRWSAFYVHGRKVPYAPSRFTLRIGRHVGEDLVRQRAAEDVGYVVMEAGEGTLCGVPLAAGVSSDTVRGFGDSPPYVTPTGVNPINAVVSAVGVDGLDGPRAALYGDDALQDGTLSVAIDEDQLRDKERRHTTEQVAWLAIGAR